MADSNVYLDDSLSKKSSRVQMFKRSRQLFTVTSRPQGIALTLAGPSAGDFGCLKHVLNFKPSDILFVDREPDGLIEALMKDDSCRTFEGDIDDALMGLLERGEKTAFINLDFCGRFSQKVKATCALASRTLADRGLLFLTFFRGRESKQERQLMGIPENDSRDSTERELARCSYIGDQLISSMGSTFELVFLKLYDSRDDSSLRHSPMGVIGFQKMPLKYRSSAWKAALNVTMDGAVSNKILKKDEVAELRSQVIALAREGKKSKDIGMILNIPPTRVAAWLANNTRKER